MTENDHKRSVQNEQFGQEQSRAEHTNDALNESIHSDPEGTNDDAVQEGPLHENVQYNAEKTEQGSGKEEGIHAERNGGDEDNEIQNASNEPEEASSSETGSNKETKEDDHSETPSPDYVNEQTEAPKDKGTVHDERMEAPQTEGKENDRATGSEINMEQQEEGKEEKKDSSPEAADSKENELETKKDTETTQVEEKDVKADKTDEVQSPEEKRVETTTTVGEDGSKKEPVDFEELTKKELVDELRKVIDEKPVQEVKDEVDQIRFHFTKKHKSEIEGLRKRFLEQGGQPQDFKPEEDPLEKQMKAYIDQFREKRAAYNKELEEAKQKNLEEKYKIIDEIKDLVNRKESLNKTFQEFRDLQARWRDTGLVPQANVKDLWETYHHHVEKFYDYIKINKELRDLDLKKNLEAKIKLCEKAEELLLEPNIITAFKTLQTYHDQWREIGPVPADMRAEIWERFKEATSKINKKHQAYYDNLKQEQRNNLESKRLLCEKAEEIADMDINSYKEWDQRSEEMKELQKIWKTIGFAPRKDNNKIYERFRSACDRFFNNKREFYARNREQQSNNLQLKTDLCIQAEALKDSTEWKKTTEDLIQLQKRWKQIGPVPKKYSDSIWKRFRSACDEFFERKSKHFDNIDSKYENNLKLKEELIAEIENFKISENGEENLKKLKEFQRRWAEIGFVPIKKKDEIQQRYREAINTKFDNLNIDENKKNIIKFKTKLDDMSKKPRSDYRLRQDREKFLNRLKQLENDIVLWENNIGFFTKSKNADQMITEVENKIKGAKEKMQVLQQKIDLIDSKLEED